MTDSATSSTTHLDRDQVLEATASCFERYGYDGTTIRRIAAQLNCAVGSIYRYFADKRDLLNAVCEQQMAVVTALLDSGGSFEQSMRRYVVQAQAAPQMYRLMFWSACVGRDHSEPVLGGAVPTAGDGRGPAAPALPGVVGEIVAGWSRRLGDRYVAQECWAMLHGSLMLGRSGEQIVQLVLQLLARRDELQTPLIASRPVQGAQPPPLATPPPAATMNTAPSSHTVSTAVDLAGQGTARSPQSDETGGSTAPEHGESASSDDVCLL